MAAYLLVYALLQVTNTSPRAYQRGPSCGTVKTHMSFLAAPSAILLAKCRLLRLTTVYKLPFRLNLFVAREGAHSTLYI